MRTISDVGDIILYEIKEGAKKKRTSYVHVSSLEEYSRSTEREEELLRLPLGRCDPLAALH